MHHLHELSDRDPTMRVRAIDADHQPRTVEAWHQVLADATSGDLCLVRASDHCPPLLSDSGSHETLGQACRERGVHVAWAYKETCTGRQYRALTFVDDTGGAQANYRGTHPDGGDIAGGFSAGNWMTIVPWRMGRVGLLLGKDLDHPEVARALRLGGAELLLWVGRADKLGPWRILAQARAIENGVACLGFGQDLILALPDGSIHAAAGSSVSFELGVAAGPPPSNRRPILYRCLCEEEPTPPG
ncbi:Carbon-nitrogen hydrolase [Arboricoccus pini]|uniref:Carbon-nitrogen hydrolase n=1 Tax=Arboricoccus pini TaxID=1963835 RepID=A0A212QNI9_9PROT|nr:nitrilase-related carbon-nitrogen hydrolase [Arboricoccus pini]SNB60884.1 Carbon-nitrogen hydrolase [Arboricoccus pini]